MIGPQLIDLGNPVSDHPLNRDRVLWLYGLPNNSGGSRWFDLTKNRNDGTLVNGPTWKATGRGDSGLTFDGADDYVSVADTTSLRPSAFTLAAWVLPTAMPTAPTHIAIAAKTRSLGSPSWGIELWAGQWNGFVFDATTYRDRQTPAATAAVNQWYRLAMTWDGSTGINVYLNGALANGATGGTASGAPNYDSAAFRVGDRNDLNTITGQVADVSVWSRDLSAAEMFTDYDLSQRGYPGVLRQYTPRAWAVSGFDASTLLPPMLPSPHPRQYKVASY